MRRDASIEPCNRAGPGAKCDRCTYIRAASILGVVALFTLLAALVFAARRVRARYRLDAGNSAAGATPQP